MHANMAFMILTQLGVGPPEGFKITPAGNDKWSDFISDRNDLESVQTYIHIRVRLIFDPPTNAFLVDALERTARELEWRLNVQGGGEDE